MQNEMFKEIRIGDSCFIEKIFSENDIFLYSELSEDTNPIHLDVEVAKCSMFGRRIVHGMLVAGLISGVLGTRLPGTGSIYMEQSLKFKAPVFWGDRIRAIVTVVEIIEEKNICKLETVCVNQDGHCVIDGLAVMLLPNIK
jgi:3-hydroxybutyryl-CoA dehydratase